MAKKKVLVLVELRVFRSVEERNQFWAKDSGALLDSPERYGVVKLQTFRTREDLESAAEEFGPAEMAFAKFEQQQGSRRQKETSHTKELATALNWLPENTEEEE